jgi:murein DD-endopeptidase MepM/ murein hydrolase activator NlpD
LAAFAFGFALGVLFLAIGLWRSGALVIAAGSHRSVATPTERTSTPAGTAGLPEPNTGGLGDLVANAGKALPPPPVPAEEPFDFPGASRAESPGATPGHMSPSTPAPTPFTVNPKLIGPRPPAGVGDADRIAPDRTGLPHLAIPLAGLDPHKLADTFDEARDGRKHDALDIMAPRGTPVRAVAQGNVAKLFTSKLGGLTVYQFDDTRTWCYYYAHLERYAKGLQDGTLLRTGDIIGYVGSSGNASPSAPHLHFAVFQLGPEKKWWEGQPIDPLPLFR